ncbi:hypothetical protein BAE44_0006970 [Dichanthelium oligosanthes]|uniref:RIN4 pathogenic type III effector avirulence factor Avr cleavage site domain-containing protein n=1 Tax=Dichanthelium oligosanthes TaxID=888268 RepID=A0A1E5W3N0_9POAL|nr:hypothetical protein BAE44_0006970 [Dichanthelium oligosanthes]
MASQTEGKQRPPRPSVPAFGAWEGGAAPPDYSLDFTKIRAARMQRRTKALSWSSFVGNATATAVAVEAPGGEEEERHHNQWSSAASEGDDDRERRGRRRHRQHGHRRLRSDGADDHDDRQPIRPGRATPKGRDKFKGYLFGCVGGLW